MFLALKQRIWWLTQSSLIRLTLWISVIFAAAFLIISVLTLFLVEQQTQRQIDMDLRATISQMDDDSDPVMSPSIVRISVDDLSDLPRPFHRLSSRDIGFTTQEDLRFQGKNDWRILLERDGDDWIMAGVSFSERDEILDLIGVFYSIVATVSFSIALTLGIWISYRAQNRFNQINSTLQTLAKGDLKARTSITTNRDDIDLLAKALDKTADQLETLVSQTRNLGANIAHDLRTPLARMAVSLDQAAQGDAAALDKAQMDLDQLANTFDAIMRIARVEAQRDEAKFRDISLRDLASEVYDMFAPVIEDDGKSLHLDSQGRTIIQGDKDLLVQALANLIQNARVYGGSEITLYANANMIGVRDTGPGVPEDMMSKIIQPMFRLDTTRQSEGAGLGLAMVQAVADRHDAQLNITANFPTGLDVSLNFTKM